MSQTATSTIGLNFNVNGLNEIANQIKGVAVNFDALNKVNDIVNKGMETLSASVGKLSKELSDTAEATKTVGSNIGKNLSAGIKLAGTSIKSGVKGIGTTFKGLVTTAKATGKAVTAGLGVIGLALNGITQIINLVTRGFNSLSQVKGVGTLTNDVKTLSESLKSAGEFVSKLIGVLAAPAISTFSNMVSNIKQVFKDTNMIDKFAKAIGFVQTALGSVIDVIKEVWNAYVSALQPVLQSGYELFTKVKDKIVDFNNNFRIIETVVGAAKITLDTFLKTLGGIGETLSKFVQGDFQGAWESAGNTVKTVGTGITKVFTESTETGAQVIEEFQTKLEKNTNNALEGLKNSYIKKNEEKKASEEQTLAEQIANLQKYIAMQKRVAEATITDEKKKAEKLKELDRGYYSQKLSLEQNAYQKIIQNNGKITDKSIKTQEDLEKQLIATQKAYDELGDSAKTSGEKAKYTWQKALQDVSSIANNLMGIFTSTLRVQEADLSAYDKRLEEVKAKWDAIEEEQASKEEEQKEKQNSDREERIANLEEELERSIQAEDQMSAKAIKIKLDQLKKEEQAEQAQATKEEQAAKKKAEMEKQKEREIAQATYERNLAEYNQNLQRAEQEKKIAIAQATTGFTSASMQAAIGYATTFASLGFPAGTILGAIGMATTIGLAAANMAKSIQTANSSFAQAQATPPPTAPQLAYGTGGMDLSKVGGYAVVGEAGPELVRQKAGGDLEVVSAERTKEYGKGGDVINLNVYVNEMVTEEVIFNFINSMKSRNLNFAI